MLPALFPLLTFGMAYACKGFRHTVSTTLSAYVQLPCCTGDIISFLSSTVLVSYIAFSSEKIP